MSSFLFPFGTWLFKKLTLVSSCCFSMCLYLFSLIWSSANLICIVKELMFSLGFTDPHMIPAGWQLELFMVENFLTAKLVGGHVRIFKGLGQNRDGHFGVVIFNVCSQRLFQWFNRLSVFKTNYRLVFVRHGGSS